MADSLFDVPEGGATVTPTTDVRDSRQPATWTSWLQQPANQAMLLSMGAQLMQPSWGGPMSNLGMAAAAGADASTQTRNRQQESDLQQQQMRQRASEGAATRATQLRVAELGAESRLDVANLRAGAMLDRARIIGLRTGAQANQFQNLVNSYFRQLSRDNPPGGTGRKSAEELHQQAMDMAERAMRQQGALADAPPGGGGGAPVTTPPAPGGPTRTTSPTTPTVTGAPPSNSRMSWEEFIQRPEARSLLTRPAARRELLRRAPEWEAKVRQQMQAWGISE